jgi:hypothetical protein
MIAVFVILATVIFGYFALIWKSSDGLNSMIKFVFVVMAIWGVVIITDNRMLETLIR